MLVVGYACLNYDTLERWAGYARCLERKTERALLLGWGMHYQTLGQLQTPLAGWQSQLTCAPKGLTQQVHFSRLKSRFVWFTSRLCNDRAVWPECYISISNGKCFNVIELNLERLDGLIGIVVERVQWQCSETCLWYSGCVIDVASCHRIFKYPRKRKMLKADCSD